MGKNIKGEDICVIFGCGRPLDGPNPIYCSSHRDYIEEVEKIDTDIKEKKTIYDLKLHESLDTSFGITIMRVPGGWIYDCWDTEKDQFKAGVFVPFNNKFQKPVSL